MPTLEDPNERLKIVKIEKAAITPISFDEGALEVGTTIFDTKPTAELEDLIEREFLVLRLVRVPPVMAHPDITTLFHIASRVDTLDQFAAQALKVKQTRAPPC